MKVVEGEFENLYFHDSPVKDIIIGADKITIDLSFAHINSDHSQNLFGKVICAKDCQLIFLQLKESFIKVYSDEQKEWRVLEKPQQKDFLHDIVETKVTDDSYYQLEGMTKGSQWSEWLIKAENIILQWEVEGESWLTKE